MTPAHVSPGSDPAGSDPAGTEPAGTDPAAPAKEPAHYAVSRIVAAPPRVVFELLTDPARHHETEPTDWVRGPLGPSPAPITEVGQVFGMEMFHENAGGRYEIHNRVIAFEPGRTVAWEPGQYEPDGTLGAGGWTWRYELAPADVGTLVTLTFDWSAVPPALREEFGLPPFGPDFLARSLASLAAGVERSS